MTSNVKIIQVSTFHHVSIYKDSNAYILQCIGPHCLKMVSVRNEDGDLLEAEAIQPIVIHEWELHDSQAHSWAFLMELRCMSKSNKFI